MLQNACDVVLKRASTQEAVASLAKEMVDLNRQVVAHFFPDILDVNPVLNVSRVRAWQAAYFEFGFSE